MKLRSWVRVGAVVAIVIVACGVGRLAHRLLNPIPPIVHACEIRTFDHVSFLRLIDSGIDQTKRKLATLKKPSSPLAQARQAYMAAKLRSLELLAPAVEAQIRSGGPTYSCTDDGYHLLRYDLDYPTFEGMEPQKSFDKIMAFLRTQPQPQPPLWRSMVQSSGGHLVASLVTIFGFFLMSRKDKKGLERELQEKNRRIVLPK